MDKNAILSLENIEKSFSGNLVLKDVNFSVNGGEVRALVGENGAGKSTLIKIISGAYQSTSGKIFMKGQETSIENPRSGIQKGIAVIYQELDLIPELTVIENIFLGIEIKTLQGFLNKDLMRQKVKSYFQEMNLSIDTDARIENLPIAAQQMVAIAKAVLHDAKILIMDEPSSSLTNKELEVLYRQIRVLKQKGVAVIYISHRLDEIFDICDTVTVLRDGVMVDTRKIQDISRKELVEMMIGRSVAEGRLNLRKEYKAPVILSADHLNLKGYLNDISFQVMRGEIFGILGLLGSGVIELGKILYGVRQLTSGTITVNQEALNLKMPADALQHSISYVTDERRSQGIFPELSVEENSVITSIRRYTNKFGFLNHKDLNIAFMEYVKQFEIKIVDSNQQIRYLSGGNQQKALIARTLLSDTDIIILSCPTKGIDVGSKFDIYSILLECSKKGKTIIAISQEITELVQICDRIIMLKNGEIYKEYSGENVSEKLIYHDLLI